MHVLVHNTNISISIVKSKFHPLLYIILGKLIAIFLHTKNNVTVTVLMQIFVVDSCSSDDQINEVRLSLEKCLSDPTLRGLPLLLLCNKQDMPHAETVDQVCHLFR